MLTSWTTSAHGTMIQPFGSTCYAAKVLKRITCQMSQNQRPQHSGVVVASVNQKVQFDACDRMRSVEVCRGLSRGQSKPVEVCREVCRGLSRRCLSSPARGCRGLWRPARRGLSRSVARPVKVCMMSRSVEACQDLSRFAPRARTKVRLDSARWVDTRRARPRLHLKGAPQLGLASVGHLVGLSSVLMVCKFESNFRQQICSPGNIRMRTLEQFAKHLPVCFCGRLSRLGKPIQNLPNIKIFLLGFDLAHSSSSSADGSGNSVGSPPRLSDSQSLSCSCPSSSLGSLPSCKF